MNKRVPRPDVKTRKCYPWKTSANRALCSLSDTLDCDPESSVDQIANDALGALAGGRAAEVEEAVHELNRQADQRLDDPRLHDIDDHFVELGGDDEDAGEEGGDDGPGEEGDDGGEGEAGELLPPPDFDAAWARANAERVNEVLENVCDIGAGRWHMNWARKRDHLERFFAEVINVRWQRGRQARLVEAGFPKSRIIFWRKKCWGDSSWRPWASGRAHGQHLKFNRIEQGEIEALLVDQMTEGIQITPRSVLDAMPEVSARRHNAREVFRINVVSVYRYMKRAGFSCRRAHAKRRSDGTDAEIEEFVARLKQILSEVPLDFVIGWSTVPRGGSCRMTTWAKRGSKDVQIKHNLNHKDVQIKHNLNHKMNFTVLAFITAALRKLPLQLIAKGKMKRSEAGFGEVGEDWTTHADSG
jgi:hypothetical protein